MKTFKLSLLLVICLFTTAVLASPTVKIHPRIAKAQKAVLNASPDDWYTLAKSAKVCIEIGENIKEASEWLDKSLKIYESDFNWEIKGDYYYRNKMPEKAIKCYTKSIKVGMKKVPNFNAKILQKKILVLRNPQFYTQQKKVFSNFNK